MAKSSLRMYGKPGKPALLRWPRHCLPLSSCMLELKKWIRNELTCWERTYRYHATRYWHGRREKVRKSNKPCVGSKVAGVEQLIEWRTRKILSTVKMRQSDSVLPALSDFHLASGKIVTKYRCPLCKKVREMEKQFNCWAWTKSY